MGRHLAQHKDALPSIRDGLGKREIARLADRSVNTLLEEGNVLQVAEALAAMEEFVKVVRKDERYVQFLRDELHKHHGRLSMPSGARIEACEAGVQYDYTHSAEWRELEAAMAELSVRKKDVEQKLRSIPGGRTAVDTETGEVIEGAFRTSRSTYRITLAR